MNGRKGLIATIAAIILITSVIFYNSFVDIDLSHQASNSVVNAIHPMENYQKEDYIEHGNLEVLVRKMAHIIEYAALGIAVILFVRFVEKNYQKKWYATAFFYVLLVAVLDEHFQGFSGRNSSTDDILLDLGGGLLGGCVGFGIYAFFAKLKARSTQKTT